MKRIYDEFIEHIVLKIIKYRIIVIFFLVFVLLLSFLFIKEIDVDNNLRNWFPEGDPVLTNYDNYLKNFGNDEVVIICVENSRGLINIENLNVLKNIENEITKLNGLSNFVSLFTLCDSYPKLKKQLNIDQNYIDNLNVLFDNSSLFYDKIISKDKKSVIFFLYYSEKYLSKKNIMKDIDPIINNFSGQNGFKIYLAGMHIIYEELNTKTIQETFKLFIFALILLILITLILLGNVFDILYILIVNIFSVSIAFSFFSFLNGKLNMVVMLFPILTIILSTSDTIHIINISKKETNITTTIHKAFLPCFLTSLTTLIGFFSLSISKIGVISDLGIYTSIGIVSSFFSAIIISIIYLSFKRKKLKDKNETSKSITYYCKFIKKSKKPIIIIVFIILILSIYFLTRLNVDTYSIGMLGKNNRIFKDSQKIEKSFGYYLPLEIMINTENLKIETLYNIEIFQEKLNKLKEIGTTLSILDVIKEFPVFINIQKKSKNILSKKKIITKSILNVLEKNEYYKNFYNEEYNTYKLTAFIKMGSARHFKTIIRDIDNIAKLTFNNSSAIPSGIIAIYAATIDHFVNNMFKSILFAIISILLVMFIIFRRPIIFIYIIIVNAIPIIAVLGIMSILRNDLDITAITMIVISCGVVVDDTIHYLYSYRHNMNKNGDTLLSVSQEVIWPIIVTSLVLIVGSISLIFSSLSPIKYSGILMASIVFFALIADILLLPVLLSFLHREALEK